MIGLLQPDEHGRLTMDNVYVIEETGHIFTVEVIGYFEPDIDCENDNGITNVFFEELNVWMDSDLMENGYIGPVQKSLHDEYFSLVCGV
jgi:hypothetical protein